jgi:endogenous inhibitor of DNA gyrase (YacG/DUF329 family)
LTSGLGESDTVRREPGGAAGASRIAYHRDSDMSIYTCPICGKDVEYDGRLPAIYPFCSARCRWVDLGRWFRGEYHIDRELTEEEALSQIEERSERPD